MNRNSKIRNKLNRKAGLYFHGKFCHTSFLDKKHNKENKRNSAYSVFRGSSKNNE